VDTAEELRRGVATALGEPEDADGCARGAA
jgi:hypothetical protein